MRVPFPIPVYVSAIALFDFRHCGRYNYDIELNQSLRDTLLHLSPVKISD